MAQLVVRDLEESVKRRLKQRAAKHGRSLEGEVREILRESTEPARKAAPAVKGFGTQLAEIFANTPKEFKIPPRSKEPPRKAKFT
jgi:plasmid stability protein